MIVGAIASTIMYNFYIILLLESAPFILLQEYTQKTRQMATAITAFPLEIFREHHDGSKVFE